MCFWMDGGRRTGVRGVDLCCSAAKWRKRNVKMIIKQAWNWSLSPGSHIFTTAKSVNQLQARLRSSWGLLLAPCGPWWLWAAPGDFWRLLGTPGSSWWPLVDPGSSWWPLVGPGSSWWLVVAPGGSWQLLVAPGDSWGLLVASWDSWRPLVAPRGSWRLLGTSGNSWGLLGASGDSWQHLDHDEIGAFGTLCTNVHGRQSPTFRFPSHPTRACGKKLSSSVGSFLVLFFCRFGSFKIIFKIENCRHLL